MLNRTIIIADDDRLLRESLSEVLSDLGCSTRHVGSGGGAIEMLRQSPCDLLLSDVDMPDMSGFQLLSWLHDHPIFPHGPNATGRHMPVVLMSARADAQMGQAARQAGAAMLLPKPVAIGRIASLVHEFLDH